MCSSVAFSMRALPLFRHVRVFNGTRFSTCRTRGHCCHSPRTISTRLQPKAVPQQHQERAAEREDQGLAQRTIVLGIESSCDDTGAAVVTSSGRLLGEAVAHQHEVHRDFGGVVPMLAREAHVGAIDRGASYSKLRSLPLGSLSHYKMLPDIPLSISASALAQ